MSMFDAVYASGRAVGESSIKNDTMVFRFRDELFEIPLVKLPWTPAALFNGYFYEIPIEKLRALEAELTAKA